MPQNALDANVAKNTSNQAAPMTLDVTGSLVTAGDGTKSVLNIIAATVVKASPGRVCTIAVNTAGSTAGTVSDLATTTGVAAANLIANIPATAGVIKLSFPAAVGIVVTPGTGQVLSVSYI